MVLRNRLCLRCLREGHYAKDCTSNCRICHGPHASPLCDQRTRQFGLNPASQPVHAGSWGYFNNDRGALSGTQNHISLLSGAQDRGALTGTQNYMTIPTGNQNYMGNPSGTQIGMTSSSGVQSNGMQYPGAQGNLTNNNMFTGSSSGYNNQLNPFSPQYRSNVPNNSHFSQPLNRGDSQGFRKVNGGVQPP